MAVIKSKKFVIRPYKKGDEILLQRNINDKAVCKYTLRIPYPYTIKEAKDWISRCIKSKNGKNKKEIHFAIDVNGEVIGGMGFIKIEKHKAEIGYWLGKKYWNRGIMTEAVKLMVNFGFKKLKLVRIYAQIFSKNRRSARVLEKNGFRFEGLLRKEIYKNNKLSDAILYAKIK
ncbi:GNAT family N-acetyltransferase [Candidatus Woesearchaeota archaeon]|nr:GNAT family N-acetyltransferase [Candidatus Woesearchaeota archaeon]